MSTVCVSDNARKVDFMRCTNFQIQYKFIFLRIHYINSDCRNSSFDKVTSYWLVVPGIEMWWRRVFSNYLDRYRSPLSLVYGGFRVFPGGKQNQRDVNHTLLSSALRMDLPRLPSQLAQACHVATFTFTWPIYK